MKINRDTILIVIILGIISAFALGQTLITNIFIAALMINWFLDKTALKNVMKVFYSKEFWVISSLFWLTLLGMLYTDPANQSEGWKYVERRLGLLIFPLIIGTMTLPKLTSSVLSRALILLIIIVGISGFGFSYYDYLKSGNLVYFYNNNLLILFGHQAVYFSLFINVVILFLAPVIEKIDKLKDYLLIILFLIFCLIFQYFLASRLSLLISFLLIGYFIYSTSSRYLGSTKTIWVGSFLGTVLLILVVFSSNTIDRFKSLTSTEYDITSTEEEYNLNDEGEASNWNGLTIRLAIWSCAGQLIADNPLLGVGTGDYRTELHKYFKKNGFVYGIMKNYTTHNQYIYILVTFGLIGLLLFFGIHLIAFINGLKYSDKRFLYLQIIFGICFLTENLLNRNQGIITYAFFSSLLVQLRD